MSIQNSANNIRKNHFLAKSKGFFFILRPFNSSLAGLATFVGIMIAIGYESIPKYFIEISLAMIVTTCIAGGGYVINDYFDLAIDKINQPQRPLPSGLISPKEAYYYSIILFSLGFIFSILLAIVEKAELLTKIITPMLALTGIVCLYSYALFFKRVGGIGNLIVTFLVNIPLIYGGIIINQFEQSLYPILVASTLMLAREIVKDVEDVKGDEKSSKKISTLPMIIGVNKAAWISKGLLILFLICSPAAFLMTDIAIYQSWGLLIAISIADILVITSLINLRGNEENLIKNATFSKKLLKSGLAIGVFGLILASFTPFSQLGL